MSHLDILLPFALPPPEIAPDLLQELNMPALSILLGRAKASVSLAFDPLSRALPHEIWLAGQLGLMTGQLVAESSPTLAISRLQSLHPAPDRGIWFLLQPVHIQVAREHLMLTDMRCAPLSEQESRALFQSAQPLFQAAGKTLQYGRPDTWFVRADDWRGLQTATPDAACGRSVDMWMPKGEGERAWRKLQNDIQIEWHEHAVNIARAQQRLPPVNSLWLWGGADASLHVADKPGRYTHADKTLGWADVASASGAVSVSTPAPALSEPHLLVLDNLSESALAENWGNWLESMHALEEMWFAPLLGALQAGQVGQIKLIVGHRAQLREFIICKRSLLKFWAKPSLARLLP
jgi:hypothetical protein